MNFIRHYQLRRRRSIKSTIFEFFCSDTASTGQPPPLKKRISNRMTGVALGLAAAYWLFQSMLSLLADGNAGLTNALFPSDIGKIFSGLLATFLFMALGLYADSAIRRRRRAAAATGIVQRAFLVEMSHEIRTPLNAILGTVEMMRQAGGSETRQTDLEVLESASRCLLALTGDILDLAGIEVGKLALKEEAFDIRALMDESIRIVTPEVRRKHLALACHVAPEIPDKLVGDPARLRQVLLNLLANAVKFTDQGNIALELAVSAEADDAIEILVRVRDTGIGIAPEEHDRIFDAFCQAGDNRRHGGAGLGLAISARIVERMGGRIRVESRPGKGSTFHFTARFGRVSADGAAVEAASRPVRQANLGDAAPLRLLVAEDAPVNRMFISRMLETWGHQVDLAADGQQAVTAAGNTDYDLVIMDVQMPGISGLEAACRIREQERTAGRRPTPIIATTGHALPGDRQRCLDAGMDAYLAKPVVAEKLASEINRLLPCRAPRPIAATPAAPGMPAARIDLESLARAVGGNSVFVKDLVETFLADAPVRVSTIRNALKTGEKQQLKHAAHDLKGMLRGFSLEGAAADTERLERMAIEKAWDESTALALADRLAARLSAIERTARRELGKWGDRK